jgi:alkylation response protein AidB-like acyl-CoA dehydrogenase
MLKLRYADLSKRVYALGAEILGPRALGIAVDGEDTIWVERHLLSFADSIAGGTSEIQRNIIGERVLGLPR